MKSESVTKAWEFYRDNCQGFKEPMRKEFRRLDEYVASLESENAKLRELVRSFHSAMLCTLDTGMWPTDPKWLEKRMEELGVES